MATLPKHSMACLCEISRGPQPTQVYNPGVVNLLVVTRELAKIVLLPSPYQTHRGKNIPHLQILPAGRRLLGEIA